MIIGCIGLLVTIIAAPIVLAVECASLTALECASLTASLLGVLGKFISRRLEIQSIKHNEIRVLAESKLNTIQDYVSTALSDGNIDDKEFGLILSEITKYHEMKDEIRTRTHVDEKTKNSVIQQGINQARKDFIKKSRMHNDISLSLHFWR